MIIDLMTAEIETAIAEERERERIAKEKAIADQIELKREHKRNARQYLMRLYMDLLTKPEVEIDRHILRLFFAYGHKAEFNTYFQLSKRDGIFYIQPKPTLLEHYQTLRHKVEANDGTGNTILNQ
jgi:hypothetical protein